MGCIHSNMLKSKKSRPSIMPNSEDIESTHKNNQNDFGNLKNLGLEELQIKLIENTWKLLVENISKVGVITFMKLFETHPDVQDVFLPFRGISKEDLKYNQELREHALRVMGSLQKVVARIHEPEKCQKVLNELGKRHFKYGAKKEHIQLVGKQFIIAINSSLEAYWSSEVENAWAKLFDYINYHMVQGMIEASKS